MLRSKANAHTYIHTHTTRFTFSVGSQYVSFKNGKEETKKSNDGINCVDGFRIFWRGEIKGLAGNEERNDTHK